MPNGKVVRGVVHRFRIAVDEGLVGIADYLSIGVIFHHDDEHVIQMTECLLVLRLPVPTLRPQRTLRVDTKLPLSFS